MLMMTKRRLAARSVFPAFFLPVALLFATPASSTIIDLVDGGGSLIWDTSIGVTSGENTNVSHSLFPSNRHPHEGWFIYVKDLPFISPNPHEFTDFTMVSNGASSDTVISTWEFLPGEEITLELTYSIDAVGPEGLPLLGWTGELSRPENVSSLFPKICVRLFNVFDYNVGTNINMDSATVTQTTGPDTTLIAIEGTDGISGSRGAYGPAKYSVDVLPDILDQIQTDKTLNDTTEPGQYDVSGAYEWDMCLCSDPLNPKCPPGGGDGAFGGFGGFGAVDAVPEPTSVALMAIGLLAINYRRRK